jgi:hypothetical protein
MIEENPHVPPENLDEAGEARSPKPTPETLSFPKIVLDAWKDLVSSRESLLLRRYIASFRTLLRWPRLSVW